MRMRAGKHFASMAAEVEGESEASLLRTAAILHRITILDESGRIDKGVDWLAELEAQAKTAGRREGMEEAARVADEYAAEREEDAPFEDDADYAERMLVYAKHVRKVAAAIRALATGKE